MLQTVAQKKYTITDLHKDKTDKVSYQTFYATFPDNKLRFH
jgi:hypothetical protein